VSRSEVPTIVENSAKCVDNKTLTLPFRRRTVQLLAFFPSRGTSAVIWRHAVALLTAVGCTSSHSGSGMKVGLVTPGSVSDAAWNSGAYQGLLRIRDSLQVHISHAEARTPAEQSEALRAYASQGYDVVFAHGFEFQDLAERVSENYPHTVFIVTSGRRTHLNVSPLIFRLEEASYLAGMVAGRLTKSNILGFIGGIELPPIKAAYQGWLNGARAVNPRVQSRAVYLNSFDDVAAGREAALALMQAGADVFHHNADAAALGLFQAVKQHDGVYVFGANTDQSRLARGHVPGSAVIDLPHAFLLIASEVRQGNFVPHVEVFGLRSQVVKYVPDPALTRLVPASLQERMRAAADSIAKGTLVAAPRPGTMEARALQQSRSTALRT
jgi:basic membrane protein A